MDKHFPVRAPMTVSAPRRLTNCHAIEIKVVLTPISYMEAYGSTREQKGESLNSSMQMVRLEAEDSRAVFHLTRQMIEQLMREWMGAAE